ncbi:MAG: DUF3164 family protein [Mariprofundus sp.]|nr:DUF3164 family protein [Mariprofundus sp.]
MSHNQTAPDQTTPDQTIPEGYKKDDKGRLIPVGMIKDIDMQRDELVQEIVSNAKALNDNITHFKIQTSGDIQAFLELSAEKYGIQLGGKKGNINLVSFDGKYKVTRAISDRLVFDERLQVAKELIDICIHKWSEGSNVNIQVLVQDAFQTDKQGQINTGRVLGLMRLDIDDVDWKKAMTAIKDSMQVAGSKSYIRVYERQTDGSYKAIALDIASA